MGENERFQPLGTINYFVEYQYRKPSLELPVVHLKHSYTRGIVTQDVYCRTKQRQRAQLCKYELTQTQTAAVQSLPGAAQLEISLSSSSCLYPLVCYSRLQLFAFSLRLLPSSSLYRLSCRLQLRLFGVSRGPLPYSSPSPVASPSHPLPLPRHCTGTRSRARMSWRTAVKRGSIVA